MTLMSKKQVAYLGPSGSYTHQAADLVFGDSVTYVPKRTIEDIFQDLSPEVPYAVVPHENSTFGNVLDTYDLLRHEDIGFDGRAHIIQETKIPIQHCLFVKRGSVKRLSDITKVLSHEQAIGQCRNFLNKNIPGAQRISVNSTSYAVRRILGLEKEPGDDEGVMAAIASKMCLKLFGNELELMAQGIQDAQENYTCFYVLQHSSLRQERDTAQNALIRISPAMTKSRPDLTPILEAVAFQKTKIFPRPSLNPTPFHDVYFIQVEYVNRGELEGVKRRVEQLGWVYAIIGMF